MKFCAIVPQVNAHSHRLSHFQDSSRATSFNTEKCYHLVKCTVHTKLGAYAAAASAVTVPDPQHMRTRSSVR